MPHDQRIPPKRNESVCPQKDLCMNVHRSSIFNSQKFETNQMFMNF